MHNADATSKRTPMQKLLVVVGLFAFTVYRAHSIVITILLHDYLLLNMHQGL